MCDTDKGAKPVFATYSSCFGPGIVVVLGGKIKYHLWGRPLAQLEEALAGIEPTAIPGKMPPDILSALDAYFSGAPVDLAKQPVCMCGFTEFQSSVYRAARKLGPGRVATYAQVAADIGKPGAQRAVGLALGRNRAPLFIPCHRVVASRGPGGWSGPDGLKSKLLALEGLASLNGGLEK